VIWTGEDDEGSKLAVEERNDQVVTHAVTHGRVAPGDEIELSAAITPKLTRVVVSDGGIGFEWPADSLPGGRVGGGYGLMLLDSQASRWGTLRAPGRFSVWFEVDHASADERAV
jgi:anti-sigma regulatory factor (Ser/Thr protein kinase)